MLLDRPVHRFDECFGRFREIAAFAACDDERSRRLRGREVQVSRREIAGSLAV